MFDPIEFGREFFEKLTVVDATIAARVAASACSRCGGPLHVGNYLRKPRGGLLAAAGEDFALRFSLCCGREGCRRRTTPPSVRFLGRHPFRQAALHARDRGMQARRSEADVKARAEAHIRLVAHLAGGVAGAGTSPARALQPEHDAAVRPPDPRHRRQHPRGARWALELYKFAQGRESRWQRGDNGARPGGSKRVIRE